MASAVEDSGKPLSTYNNNNMKVDSIRRRAKSGKGGKSSGDGDDNWHHGGDIDYTGRFSGSNKATFEQVNLPPEDETTIQRRRQIYIGSSTVDSRK